MTLFLDAKAAPQTLWAAVSLRIVGHIVVHVAMLTVLLSPCGHPRVKSMSAAEFEAAALLPDTPEAAAFLASTSPRPTDALSKAFSDVCGAPGGIVRRPGPEGLDVAFFTDAKQQSVLDDFNRHATMCRFVPAFEHGAPFGFKLFSLKPGSVYDELGFENGDIVMRINGRELSSPDKALELYSALQAVDEFSVDVRRNDEDILLHMHRVFCAPKNQSHPARCATKSTCLEDKRTK